MLEAFARRGGVSSGCPYLHTTRSSGRVSCGGSAERIVAGQARQYGKEGKPVGERATTITVSHIERREGRPSYAPPAPRRWKSRTRGTAALMHLGSGRGGASSRGSRYTPHAGAAAASPVGATQQRTQLLPASAAACISHQPSLSQPCAGGAIDRDLAGLRAPKQPPAAPRGGGLRVRRTVRPVGLL